MLPCFTAQLADWDLEYLGRFPLRPGIDDGFLSGPAVPSDLPDTLTFTNGDETVTGLVRGTGTGELAGMVRVEAPDAIHHVVPNLRARGSKVAHAQSPGSDATRRTALCGTGNVSTGTRGRTFFYVTGDPVTCRKCLGR